MDDRDYLDLALGEAEEAFARGDWPVAMCAWAMKLAGIQRLVLGLRHATLRRTDMGAYRVEAFCALTGYALELTGGVREAECLALRRRWGTDVVSPA